MNTNTSFAFQRWGCGEGAITFYTEPKPVGPTASTPTEPQRDNKEEEWLYECGHHNDNEHDDEGTQLHYLFNFGTDLCNSCIDYDLITTDEAQGLIMEDHLDGSDLHRVPRLAYLAEKIKLNRFSFRLGKSGLLWYSRRDMQDLFEADEDADYTL